MNPKKTKNNRYQIDESNLNPADFEKIDVDELTQKLVRPKPKQPSKKRRKKK